MKRQGAAFLVALVCSLASAGDEAAQFLESERVEEVRLRMRPGDWDELRSNFLEDAYYRVDFEWNGVRVQDAGIRSRGNGSRNGVKPALRVDFNRFRDRKFLGLSGLTLTNLVPDATMMRNRLAMKLYAAMGVPAPRTVYVRLFMNDEPCGLYLAVEEIAKPFLRQHFGEDSGQLYDYNHSGEWHWGVQPAQGFSFVPEPFSPKTRESNPDVQGLLNLIDGVNRATPETLESRLDERLDWRNWLTYLAVEAYIRDQDGFVGYVGTNNFYLYRRASDSRWVILPWDKDQTFETPTGGLFDRYERGELTRRLKASPVFALLRGAVGEVAVKADGWLAAEARATWAMIESDALADPVQPWPAEVVREAQSQLLDYLDTRPSAVRMMLGEAEPN